MARHGRGRLFTTRGKGAGNALLRRVILLAAAGVATITIAIIAGYYQLLAYLQGDSFRQTIADTLRSASGAHQVEVAGNLSVDGNRVSNEGISFSGMQQIEQAKATGISAVVNRAALLGRKLHLYKLTMEEASVSINTDDSQATGLPSLPSAGKTSGKKKKKASGKKSPVNPPKSKIKLDKQDFELELFECRDATLHLTRNNEQYQLLSASVTATPAPKVDTDAWQLNIESARLHSPFSYLCDSSVKSATLIYTPREIDLTDSSIMLTPGELRVKAHYDLKQRVWSTDMQVHKGNIHRLLSEDWKKRFHGELYGRLILTGKDSNVTTGTGSISVQNGVLEGLPFLSQLPVGNTYPYRCIELEKAECQVLFPFNSDKLHNAWLFDKINLRAKDGSLIVHGHVLIGTDRRLSGTLTIGLPQKMLGDALVAHEAIAAKLFTAHGEEPGYVWVNMNLSGTIDHPEEDLSVRIATLVGQNLGQLLKNLPVNNAASMLNELLRQPAKGDPDSGTTPDADKQATPADLINTASGLLRSLF